MLPRTHHLFIEEAVAHAGPWAQRWRDALLKGNDDEDVLIVPILNWRLRAAGLTHTQRPGGHFGELGFPSAKRQCRAFLQRAFTAKNPEETAWWLGRICHLLGDALVPARAHGVWHLQGDPLESFLEERLEEFVGAAIPTHEPAAPAKLIDDAACYAATFRADTTRTPWGRARHHLFARGTKLDETELRDQAHAIVPEAIARTRAFLMWIEQEARFGR